jgi:hypothetical protein
MFALYNSFAGRIYSIGGEVQTYREATDAPTEYGYEVMTLSQAINAMRARLVQNEEDANNQYGRLIRTVTTFLEEGVEGALDPDDFIEEHRALSEAVGFDYIEEKTFILEVQVSTKVKRGYGDVTWSTFDVSVDSVDSDVEVLDIELNSVDEQ